MHREGQSCAGSRPSREKVLTAGIDPKQSLALLIVTNVFNLPFVAANQLAGAELSRIIVGDEQALSRPLSLSSVATANRSSWPLSLNNRAIFPTTKSPGPMPSHRRSSGSSLADKNGLSGKPLRMRVYCGGRPIPAARYCSVMARATVTKWVVDFPAYRSAARNAALARAFWNRPKDGP